ncbi:MAG: DUF47 domain-containing protein [Flavobacteriales bacterium]|jgi:uncharacterized protein Yka (UPF0111/DUF47 family)
MNISLNTIFQALVPKDKKFIPLFEQASSNVLQAAELLRSALHADSVTRLNAHKQIEHHENQGDEFTHGILKEAAATFITPFDREDMQRLAVSLDDVIDFIHGSSKRIELYKIHQLNPAMLQMSVYIHESTKELDKIIKNLYTLRYTAQMRESLAIIKDYEKKADDLYDDAISKLFRDNPSPLEVLKVKEVLSFMTSATGSLATTASVIENVLVKFS